MVKMLCSGDLCRGDHGARRDQVRAEHGDLPYLEARSVSASASRPTCTVSAAAGDDAPPP